MDEHEERSGNAAQSGDGSPDERLKGAGADAVQAAKEQAQSGLDQGRASASAMASDSAQAMRSAADDLDSRGQPGLAQAAGRASSELERLANTLQHRTVEELTRDARELARNNPALFVAGSIGLGVALSRFFKASPAPRQGAGSAQQAGADVTPPAPAGLTPNQPGGTHG